MKALYRTAAALALAILAGGLWWLAGGERPGPAGAAAEGGGSPVMPELGPDAAAGRLAFGEYCARCHGPDAGGTEQGPPLVHKLYEPGHHADIAFVLAARQGVRAHHWRFGDMPPVEGVSDAELGDIVQYVRAVQRANGIR